MEQEQDIRQRIKFEIAALKEKIAMYRAKNRSGEWDFIIVDLETVLRDLERWLRENPPVRR